DVLGRLVGLVTNVDQVHVPLGNVTGAEHGFADPPLQSAPKAGAEQDNREQRRLARLDERERLEELIQRTKPAWQGDETLRVLDEHHLPNEEEVEGDQFVVIDELVGRLLVGYDNVQPDRGSASLARTAIGCLHDPGSAACNNAEAASNQCSRGLSRELIVLMRWGSARGSEKRHRRTEAGHCFE